MISIVDPSAFDLGAAMNWYGSVGDEVYLKYAQGTRNCVKIDEYVYDL